MTRIAFLLPTMFLIPMLAFAEVPPGFHWCSVNAGAGYSTLAGTDASNLKGQWDFEAGIGGAVVHPTDTRSWSLFLGVDYLFEMAAVRSAALTAAKNLNLTDIPLQNAKGGTSNFNDAALDLTFRIPESKPFQFYGFTGFGWFRRGVDLTGASTQGALLQPGNPAVFLRNSSSGSIDAGGGVNFTVGKFPLKPYLEAKVVHGLAINHTTTLVAFFAGLRF